MRSLIFTLIAFTVTLGVSAQDKKKTASGKWKTGGMISFVGAQTGSRNWAGGSEKFSLALAGNLQLWANSSINKSVSLENNLDLAYALVNAHSLSLRKNDDKFDWYSLLNIGSKQKIGLGVAFNLRTQLNNGFDYEDNRRRLSGFFAPAYITFGTGVNLKPSKSFNVLAGAAARWVVATNRPYSFNYQGGIKPDGSSERPLAELYGVDPQRKVDFQVGPYISARLNKGIMKNVTWRTRLDLNSDIIDEEPFKIDAYWTNMVSMRINKWLHVNYSLDMYSDDDVRMFGANKTSPATQLKSILGVGLGAKF